MRKLLTTTNHKSRTLKNFSKEFTYLILTLGLHLTHTAPLLQIYFFFPSRYTWNPFCNFVSAAVVLVFQFAPEDVTDLRIQGREEQ